jgi:hypothetical protein
MQLLRLAEAKHLTYVVRVHTTNYDLNNIYIS